MAHEITNTDHLVLTGEPAWHGLGTVVENAPTPTEALALAGLGWQVEKWSLDALCGVEIAHVSSHVATVRSDTRSVLGIVGSGYRPVQNDELASFVEALRADGRVAIETAGSIRGGRRVWFLARGSSIWAGGKDEVKPYLLVANGHDGSLALTCQPTSIRVVCKNTLAMSLSQSRRSTTVSFRHKGDIADKLEDARRALGMFDRAQKEFSTAVTTLDAKAMSKEDLQRYWLEVYTATLDPVPAHPADSAEQARAETCRRVLTQWASNFDHDRQATGLAATAWVGLNAVTHWFDHQRPVRASTLEARTDNRILGNLWGTAATAKVKAMQLALMR